jgi:hypothetical protein
VERENAFKKILARLDDGSFRLSSRFEDVYIEELRTLVEFGVWNAEECRSVTDDERRRFLYLVRKAIEEVLVLAERQEHNRRKYLVTQVGICETCMSRMTDPDASPRS